MKSEIAKNQKIQKPQVVYYVWNYLEWGGAQVYFLGIAARIKDRARVVFVFPRETNPQFLGFCEQMGIEYEFLDAVMDLKPAATLKRKLARHLNKIRAERLTLRHLKKYDFKNSILHIELTPWQSVLSLLMLCRRAEVFVTMHNALPETSKWRRKLWKAKFKLVTRLSNFHLFASNKDARESLKPFVSTGFLERVKVTYTNVNPEEIGKARRADINREALLEKFGLPENKTLVFALGQFIDRKGRWTFLEAAQKILRQSADFAFVWMTNSELTAAETQKIEEFELGSWFRLIKSEEIGAEHLDLMKFLRLADIYTLPSLVEGLPISLLEAMALGLPSISTNVYAIPEAIKDQETGLLIEPANSDALAAAIITLERDPILRDKIARAGRDWVLANFNEVQVAEIAYRSYVAALNQK